MKRNFLFALLLLGVTHTMYACATLTYSAEPIEAWVVDAETNRPLEGVIVVANWALESTSRIIPHQTNPAGSLMILETVTDKDGRFYFPAWGTKWHLGSGDLDDKDPELILFKSGYKHISVSNSLYSRPKKYYYDGMPGGAKEKPTGSKRISFWNGETVKMERFKGSQEEYARHLSFLETSISFAFHDLDKCEWKNIPLMIVAMHKEVETLRQKKVKYFLSSPVHRLLVNEEKNVSRGCGSPREFLKGYLP